MIVLVFFSSLGLLAIVIGFVWARIDSRNLRYRPYFPPMLAAIALTVTFVLIVLYQQVSPGQGRSLSVSGWLLLSFFLFGILHACSFLGYFVGHRGPKQTQIDATIDQETDLVATEETGNPYQPPSF